MTQYRQPTTSLFLAKIARVPAAGVKTGLKPGETAKLTLLVRADYAIQEKKSSPFREKTSEKTAVRLAAYRKLHGQFPRKTTALFLALYAAGLQSAQTAPDPFDGARQILSARFQINRPTTETEEQFLAVRELMNRIDEAIPGKSEHHPEKGVTCDVCHVKDAISVDHAEIKISDESNPEKSCGKTGCHDMTTAGRMPFYVRPFVSLDETDNKKQINQNLAGAKRLIDYIKDFKTNVAEHLNGQPTHRGFSINLMAQDKKLINPTHDVPIGYFEPKTLFDVKKNADVLPLYASTGIVNELLSLAEIDLTAKTRQTGALEARVSRAADLTGHLDLWERNASIQSLLTSNQLVLSYNKARLPDELVDFLTAKLQQDFPTAALKSDTTTSTDNDPENGSRRTVTWEISGESNGGKTASINVQITSEGLRRNPATTLSFANLMPERRADAIHLLDDVQKKYDSEFTADQARYSLNYTADTLEAKALLTETMQKSKEAAWKGDLRRALNESENTAETATVPAAGSGMAKINALKALVAANPAAVRRIQTSFSYASDSSRITSVNSNIMLAALPRISLTAQQSETIEDKKEKLLFTVSRETASNQPLTVYLTLGGTAKTAKDYAKPKLSVTIPKNQSSANVAVKVNDDKLSEGTETISVALAQSKKHDYSIDTQAAVTVSIIDNE